MVAFFQKGKKGYFFYDGNRFIYPDRSIIEKVNEEGPCIVKGSITVDKGEYAFMKGEIIKTAPVFNFKNMEIFIEKNYHTMDRGTKEDSEILVFDNGLQLMIVRRLSISEDRSQNQNKHYSKFNVGLYATKEDGSILEICFFYGCNYKYAYHRFAKSLNERYESISYTDILEKIGPLFSSGKLSSFEPNDDMRITILVRIAVNGFAFKTNAKEIKVKIIKQNGKPIMFFDGDSCYISYIDSIYYIAADDENSDSKSLYYLNEVADYVEMTNFKKFITLLGLDIDGSEFTITKDDLKKYMRDNFISAKDVSARTDESPLENVVITAFGENFKVKCWNGARFNAALLNNKELVDEVERDGKQYLEKLRKHYGKYVNKSNIGELKRLTLDNVLKLDNV